MAEYIVELRETSPLKSVLPSLFSPETLRLKTERKLYFIY